MMKLFILVALLTLLGASYASPTWIRPPRLHPGDTVGFISPASPVSKEIGNVEEYKKNVTKGMTEMGLRLEFSPNAFAEGHGLAGTDEQRASDIMWAFTNPNITAIIANCGGWGCDRIVDKLDYKVIAAHPKIFMGYSDLTACISAISTRTGLQTFHGPMGYSAWGNTLNTAYMSDVLMKADNAVMFRSTTQTTTIVPGKGRGRLIGGNLSVFVSLLGSEYFPPTDEPFILFLEDVDELSYSIDRLLTSLHLRGMFENAQALVWGQCTSCPRARNGDFAVDELVVQKWGNLLNVPSFMGAMIGHIHAQFTLPFGGLVEVDADAGTIQLLQAAVL